jgi:hypothetical protein
VRLFNVPALSWLKALSVGANIVRPSKELFSWLAIWVLTWVSLSKRKSVVYWLPFSRMAVRFSGSGVGPGATGVVLAWAVEMRNVVKIRKEKDRDEEAIFIIFS